MSVNHFPADSEGGAATTFLQHNRVGALETHGICGKNTQGGEGPNHAGHVALEFRQQATGRRVLLAAEGPANDIPGSGADG